MPKIESDPNRSFNAFNDYLKINQALLSGASEAEIFHWIESQLGTLLVEHGPIENQRQPVFHYDVIDKGLVSEPEIYFGDGKHFGDQHVSFQNMERDYPEVALGWQKVARLFSDKKTKVGDGVVWISPMKFYLKPRLDGDKASTHDVLNFYKIISRHGDHTQVMGQTIKLNGALTDRQYALLLSWHDENIKNPAINAEEVVAMPLRFGLGNITLNQHYDWLNELSIINSEFKFLLTGTDNETMKSKIYAKLEKYLPRFRHYLTTGNIDVVQNLIWELVWEIKDGDAVRLGIDPMIARMQYLQMQDMMTHRLMSLPVIDQNIDKYGFNAITEKQGFCRIHGPYTGDKCPKCNKSKN